MNAAAYVAMRVTGEMWVVLDVDAVWTVSAHSGPHAEAEAAIAARWLNTPDDGKRVEAVTSDGKAMPRTHPAPYVPVEGEVTIVGRLDESDRTGAFITSDDGGQWMVPTDSIRVLPGDAEELREWASLVRLVVDEMGRDDNVHAYKDTDIVDDQLSRVAESVASIVRAAGWRPPSAE